MKDDTRQPEQLHKKTQVTGQTRIGNSIVIPEINENVQIYEGDFQIIDHTTTLDLKGTIDFQWFPIPRTRFSGNFNPGTNSIALHFHRLKVVIDGQEVGTGTYSDPFNTPLEGYIKNITIGDVSKSVKSVNFSIPNLRKISAETAERDEDGARFHGRKITLEDDDYETTILRLDDKDIDKMEVLAKNGGGYFISYVGECVSKKGTKTYNKINEHFKCLDQFLSFMNGQRTSCIFLKGFKAGKEVWSDYSEKRIDPYIGVSSWASTFDQTSFNLTWKQFKSVWKNNGQLLNYALHWYFESNKNSGLLEGSTILVQAALETICNWLIIEKLGIIRGQEAKNLSAQNKVRILCSTVGLSLDIPTELKNLKNEKKTKTGKEPKFIDGPEALTEIRNALTHGNTQKYSSLTELSLQSIFEAKQLGLWYVEVALLYAFNHRDIYFNRITKKHVLPPYVSR
ncbi:hypothetical protein J2Y45_006045 [Dyadobacter sp. BE34]|uniref:YopA central domain-containing protein n=1 Tax=Dyadobacter fermentans TaxID=94254 RepID=A0ABU1R601_9BACT|nr:MULTISPECIES: hypothetical protein [Dyadobacter]MDR6808833.1 hypothetical protein [Dyadobacter fermentans]MDR7046576.1 hypothetical protein [Dyadobacter sp. BE242]MDR7200889.1 hypothetical protein [Dyadobacter sp. BE34]MDR7218850.1 hypothetical protein [Dyadobacter sp. BE31]MDR7266779.1 hypothetical protein [Dyadobacter sp. BE32]